MPLNPPDIKELQAIVDWVNLAEDVREVSLKFGDMELFISRDRQQPAAVLTPAPVTPAAAAPAPAPAVAAPAPAPAVAPPVPSASEPSSADALAPDEVLIKAPMVGTFYASPKPGAPNFVSVGDNVAADSVLCIVEVMKLMSNIEAQVEGTVTRILVENEQAVEYGQPLMVIKRRV
ncbi:acetyl-CoA carboxylase biotin carboxyl carrier protein [Arthrobacter sp. ISL-69]|uniref:acetyl-CoA carboxylase biotin carboxyl carrier protein n=1 Tax=Arthrobacter sp. ISL-69 TaxID=2819113 RepID=UPI001BE57AA8|nr:acetyl-CoA carboxylase biotin carboxyl carrier protein [Arthrobacter sp. ISL-69]MBT2539016.1 acetyl-CoA carboxylase biotin carboxyl carrier protein [Arthrobacter sp. ISL-69]